jgi:hypothetical protein
MRGPAAALYVSDLPLSTARPDFLPYALEVIDACLYHRASRTLERRYRPLTTLSVITEGTQQRLFG